jgi:hypothetical protein
MKRIRVKHLDTLRGIAILFMVFFHTFEFYEGDLTAVAASAASNPFAVVIKFLGRWAGLFVLISGFAHSMSLYYNVSSGRSSMKRIFQRTIIHGLWLICIESIFSIFAYRTLRGGGLYNFNEGPFHYSLLSGIIETGQIQLPSLYTVFYSMGPLRLLGVSLILYTIILALLFRNQGYKKWKRNCMILGILGTTVILLSDSVIEALRPQWISAIENDHYLKGFLLSNLIGDTHALFPVFGYALYGAMFGLAFVHDVNRVVVRIIAGTIGLCYATAAYILYRIRGEPPIEYILRPISLPTACLQIGLMIILTSRVYYHAKSPRSKDEQNASKSRSGTGWIGRFGRASLTVYLLEGLVGTLFKFLLLDLFFPDWATSMFWIVVYAFTMVVVWHFLLIQWEKHRMKYSVEWFTRKILKSLGPSKPQSPVLIKGMENEKKDYCSQ